MSTKREAEKQIKRALKELEEEKLDISLPSELMKRIDDTVEFLGYKNREELIQCIIRRFVDKYQSSQIKVKD